MPELTSVQLDGKTLTIRDVVRIARNTQDSICTLSHEACQRIEASYALKQQFLQTKQPMYGITTGFGDSGRRQISARKAAQLQSNLIRFLLCGTGPLVPPEVTRATMLIRVNCLARGNSAIRKEVINRLLYFLGQDILPLIPACGSVGASGDLVPLSYLAAMVIGEGNVCEQGTLKEIAEVLKAHKLEPLTLEAKEGLALVNGTSFMSGFACLTSYDVGELAFIADVSTAMACEALCCSRGHFEAFIHAQKPHQGQIKSAANIARLLEDSCLAQSDQQILASYEELAQREYQELGQMQQSKYSLRCAPHIIGVLYDTLSWVEAWIETEINSSNDNPLFDVETQAIHHGGNFYGGHIAQAMDALKIAVANIADLLDRQLELVVDEKFNNGLTPNLIPFLREDAEEAGLYHGFKGMQLTCSALTAEALKLAGPASIFSRSTEAHNQDKVSMGSIAARDAYTMVELVQHVAAIHLLALCQAVDLRGRERMSTLTRAVYEAIRQTVPFVGSDRRMDDDIEKVVTLIRSSTLRQAIETTMG
ncbi:HAL/PAL/TAL family ammonia-lyase [Ktedonosporobacter rubrisoli]|nr:aromatic amino acid ammonia-lyase [Ktedonosporobacter rubrisoli]